MEQLREPLSLSRIHRLGYWLRTLYSKPAISKRKPVIINLTGGGQLPTPSPRVQQSRTNALLAAGLPIYNNHTPTDTDERA